MKTEFSVQRGHAPATNVDLPNFILFRANGVDLGGRDATILDFSTNLTATRGVGENADVVTLTADGGGGPGPDPGTVSPYWMGEFTGFGQFDGSDILCTPLNETIASADMLLNTEDGPTKLEFMTAGVYQVTIRTRLLTDSSWPAIRTVYGMGLKGSYADGYLSPSKHSSADGDWSGIFPTYNQWRVFCDTFTIEAQVEDTVQPYVVATSVSSTTRFVTIQAQVTIQRIADLP